jgi:hypothetical protein
MTGKEDNDTNDESSIESGRYTLIDEVEAVRDDDDRSLTDQPFDVDTVELDSLTLRNLEAVGRCLPRDDDELTYATIISDLISIFTDVHPQQFIGRTERGKSALKFAGGRGVRRRLEQHGQGYLVRHEEFGESDVPEHTPAEEMSTEEICPEP